MSNSSDRQSSTSARNHAAESAAIRDQINCQAAAFGTNHEEACFAPAALTLAIAVHSARVGRRGLPTRGLDQEPPRPLSDQEPHPAADQVPKRLPNVRRSGLPGDCQDVAYLFVYGSTGSATPEAASRWRNIARHLSTALSLAQGCPECAVHLVSVAGLAPAEITCGCAAQDAHVASGPDISELDACGRLCDRRPKLTATAQGNIFQASAQAHVKTQSSTAHRVS